MKRILAMILALGICGVGFEVSASPVREAIESRGLLFPQPRSSSFAPALLQPSAPVRGLTPRRLWASAAALLGVAGVVAARLARARAAAGWLGLLAAINGALNLAVATGGPATGNGVVGGAAALVLGLIAIALSRTVAPRQTA